MSSTAAASSSLCMVALGRPKSTTGQSCDQEAAVGGAAVGGQARRAAGLGLDRGADDVVDRPGRGQEGLARDLRLDRRAGRRFLGGAADQRDQVLAALEVVEADVELGAGRSRG